MLADLGDEWHDLFLDDYFDHQRKMPTITDLLTASGPSRNAAVDYRVSIRGKAVIMGHRREVLPTSASRRAMPAEL